jgi:UDP-glucose 4-epimerase
MLRHLTEKPLKPSRVVVLGAQGFVGSHALRTLKKAGIETLGLSRSEIDLLSTGATDQLLAYLKPGDVLVFSAAIAPCKNNSQLIDNLKMAQAVSGVFEKVSLSQVVYISSDAVYADDLSLVTEASPVQPASLHGMMHAARELMLKTMVGKIPLAILRPSLLYGIDDPHNGYGPNRFKRLAEESKPIVLFGNGEEKRDHVFIEDLAQVMTLTIQHCSKGILNIATGHSLSFREVAQMIVDQSGEALTIQGTPRQNPISHRYFDITAFYKGFPYFHYTSFKEGIINIVKKTVEPF